MSDRRDPHESDASHGHAEVVYFTTKMRESLLTSGQRTGEASLKKVGKKVINDGCVVLRGQ